MSRRYVILDKDLSCWTGHGWDDDYRLAASWKTLAGASGALAAMCHDSDPEEDQYPLIIRRLVTK